MSSGTLAEESGKSAPRVAPGPKGCLLVGSLPEMRKDSLKLLLDTQRNYGDVARLQLVEWITLVSHPDGIKHVLQDNHTNYRKGFGYDRLKALAGEGLVTSQGDFWKRQRRLAQPAFHRQRLGGFVNTFTARTLQMVQRWGTQPAGHVWDIHDEMMRVTLAIVGDTLFSMDLLEQAEAVGQAVGPALEIINDRFISLFVVPQAIPTPQNVRFKHALDTLDKVVFEVIQSRRNSPANDRPDLLSMLMAARDEETGEGMTDRQLRDEVMTMLIAGHETTANALSWTLYLLSLHPDIERKLRQEVQTVLGGRTVTLEDLPKLDYTLRVLEESMRLFPPVWLISRKAIAADEIGGYHIPAGSSVFLSPYVTHRHPQFWENPEGFDPDRFTADKNNSRPRFAYYPFAAGTRMCIGKDFALMEAQAILATIVQHYRIALVAGARIEPDPSVTLRPLHGIPATLIAQ